MDLMDLLEERIADLSRERLNCSQIMMRLSLDLRDIDNPELVRCMRGLGGGMHSMHVCGTLTSGCCLLASYEEAERAMTASNVFLPSAEIIKSYVQWFEQRFGSLLCRDLIEGDRSKIRTLCPGLIKESFEKCIEILLENGIDPAV